MAIRTLFLLAISVVALSARALSSPNGKFRMTVSADGVEIAACTPRGFGLPRLVLRCGPARKLSESRRVKERMPGGSRSYAEARYLLAGGDTLTVRLHDGGVAWNQASHSEIGLVRPVHNWIAYEDEDGGIAYRKDDITADGSSHMLPVITQYGSDLYGLLKEDGLWHTFHFGTQGDLLRNESGDFDHRLFFDPACRAEPTCVHDMAMAAMSGPGSGNVRNFTDYPQEVADCLMAMPEEWDETLWLGGYPGEYAAIARRKGNRWWISVINGTDRPLTNLRVDSSPIFKSVRRRAKVILFEDAPHGGGSGWQISRLTAMPRRFDIGPRGGISAFIEIY